MSSSLKAIILMIGIFLIGLLCGTMLMIPEIEDYKETNILLESKIRNLTILYKELKGKYHALSESYKTLNATYMKILEAYTHLQENYVELRANYTKLKRDYEKLLKEQEEAIEYAKRLEQQVKELLYFRGFLLYDYAHDQLIPIVLQIKAADYWYYRLNVSREIMSLNQRLSLLKKEVRKYVTYNDPYIRDIALELRKYAGMNDELYANLVLQLVHEIAYNITKYPKYPLEVLVEGTGDCDNLAVLAAALMRAGGLDVVIILCEVKQNATSPWDAHAMIGVYLQSPPTLPFKFGRAPWYIELKGKRYYLAECTWPSLEFLPWNYTIQGSLIGDNPWYDIEIEAVIPVE